MSVEQKHEDPVVADVTSTSEMKRDLTILRTGRAVPGYQNDEAWQQKHAELTGGKPYFRFPPEPNGFLHIGHAKSMNLNFGNAKAHGGCCYLRYDDTNPESEEQVYIDAIEEMARWMGWSPDWITHSSDHFDKLHALAVDLINAGKAYVDHSTGDELKRQREEKTDSPFRDRPVAENLKEFEKMRQGRYAEGKAILRLKMNMQDNNPNMRDVVAYRVKYTAHPHVGAKWCIYPSYDYTHCLIDSLEHIDYSLCTLEFETRRESYFWLLDQLNMWKPHVWEFSRLNVTGSLLSKRKINVLVKEGIVRGFDDPRLMTLAGMRRRGYTPEAINKFCDLVGITRSMNVIQVQLLEATLREDLDERCARRQLVTDPIRVVIDNWPEGVDQKVVQCGHHPRKPEDGQRDVAFTKEFYIDGSDFHTEDDNAKFYGLAPGPRVVGLKYSGTIVCTSYEKDAETGKPTIIHCDIDFERTQKPKTNITWVSCPGAVAVECRHYDYLLNDDKAAIDPEFLKYINEKSETIVPAFAEPAVADFAVYDKFQAERFGYYSVDPDTKDAKDGKMVLNRVISLREDKQKTVPPTSTKGGKGGAKKEGDKAKK